MKVLVLVQRQGGRSEVGRHDGMEICVDPPVSQVFLLLVVAS